MLSRVISYPIEEDKKMSSILTDINHFEKHFNEALKPRKMKNPDANIKKENRLKWKYHKHSVKRLSDEELDLEYRMTTFACRTLGSEKQSLEDQMKKSRKFRKSSFAKEAYETLENQLSIIGDKKDHLSDEMSERSLPGGNGERTLNLRAQYQFYTRKVQDFFDLNKRIPKKNTYEGQKRSEYIQEMKKIEQEVGRENYHLLGIDWPQD